MKRDIWGFLDTGFQSPTFNMALDEALLNWHSKGEIPPIIRFYGWKPATLSIGYFQNAEKEIHLEKVKKLGLGFVRRPTGGKAVLHEHELTYSVIVSEHHPKMPSTVIDSYRVISEGILKGFQHLGLKASFAVPTEENRKTLNSSQSAICFHASSWYELVVEGRKIVGSAQTRKKGVILQHGSILLELDREKLLSLFQFPSEKIKKTMEKSIVQKAVAINDISPKKISLEEAKDAFYKGFCEALNVELTPFHLTEEQLFFVKKLQQEKYESEDWNFAR